MSEQIRVGVHVFTRFSPGVWLDATLEARTIVEAELLDALLAIRACSTASVRARIRGEIEALDHYHIDEDGARESEHGNWIDRRDALKCCVTAEAVVDELLATKAASVFAGPFQIIQRALGSIKPEYGRDDLLTFEVHGMIGRAFEAGKNCRT